MKRGFRLFFVCLLLFTMALPVTLIADTSTQNIVSQVLETFDPEDSSHEWYVQGSKFIAEGYPRFKLIDGFPFALYGRAGDEGNHQVLGMQGSFDRKGFNYLEIFPVEDGPDGKVPVKVTVPGRVKELDLWVWGSLVQVYFRGSSGRLPRVCSCTAHGQSEFPGLEQSADPDSQLYPPEPGVYSQLSRSEADKVRSPYRTLGECIRIRLLHGPH